MTTVQQFDLEVARATDAARRVRDLIRIVSVGNCPLIPCEDCPLVQCIMRETKPLPNGHH